MRKKKTKIPSFLARQALHRGDRKCIFSKFALGVLSPDSQEFNFSTPGDSG